MCRDALGRLQNGRFLKERGWNKNLLAEEKKRLFQARSSSLSGKDGAFQLDYVIFLG